MAGFGIGPEQFAPFGIADRHACARALETELQPALLRIGGELAPGLSRVVGGALAAEPGRISRRRDAPPGEVVVAFAPGPPAPRGGPHLELAVNRSHLHARVEARASADRDGAMRRALEREAVNLARKGKPFRPGAEGEALSQAAQLRGLGLRAPAGGRPGAHAGLLARARRRARRRAGRTLGRYRLDGRGGAQPGSGRRAGDVPGPGDAVQAARERGLTRAPLRLRAGALRSGRADSGTVRAGALRSGRADSGTVRAERSAARGAESKRYAAGFSPPSPGVAPGASARRRSSWAACRTASRSSSWSLRSASYRRRSSAWRSFASSSSPFCTM